MFRHKRYSKFTNEELVAKIKQESDAYAIGILYERFGHLVYGLALHYLKNKNDAEDIVSALFEQLQSKIQKYEIQHFKSWLFILTKNDCLQFLRKYRTSSTLLEEQFLQIDAFEENHYSELQLEQLEQALHHLKSEQKACVQLFYLESKSYQEISILLDLPISKVKSAIQNGKRNLKISLEQHHEFKK